MRKKIHIILGLTIGMAFFINSMATAEVGFGESDIFPLDMSKKPTIVGVAPQGGFTGTKVMLTGEGFMLGFIDGTTVKIGGFAATNVTVVSATKLTATVPTLIELFTNKPQSRVLMVRNWKPEGAKRFFTFQGMIQRVTSPSPRR